MGSARVGRLQPSGWGLRCEEKSNNFLNRRLSMTSFSTGVGRVAEATMRGMSLHRTFMHRSPISENSFRKLAQILLQCPLSKTMLISRSTNFFLCNSRSKPLPVLTNCSGLKITTWYLKLSIAYDRWEGSMFFKICAGWLTRKFSDVAVSAPMNIAFIPIFSNNSTFCFPSRLSGVITTWMWPAGQKRRGIQKVSVLPIPVPAIIMTSQSRFKIASTTLACQRHG